jgi:predicted metal-binding membrane protein
MAIWHNVWQFGIVCGHFVYFSHFGMFVPRKIWQPWSIGLGITIYQFSNLKFACLANQQNTLVWNDSMWGTIEEFAIGFYEGGYV